MDLKDINQIEHATRFGRKETFRLGVALLFVVGTMLYTYLSVRHTPGSPDAGNRSHDGWLHGTEYRSQ